MRLQLALITLCFSSGVMAADCGGLNQRPCKVFERVPSCNRGLVENFAKGRCLAATAQPAQPAQPAVKQRPGNCGRHHQRPCNVTEFIPSCDAQLVEHQGQCKSRAEATAPKPRPGHCGRDNQRPCNVAEFIPSCEGQLVEHQGQCQSRAEAAAPKPRPGHCGRDNQRPCNVAEFIPSCEGQLVEHQGQCQSRVAVSPLANCGKQDQRACNVWERIPSCDADLAEIRGACMRKGECGAEGQRPCLVGERIPSCNAGLKENFKKNVCAGLAPGETPFTGGLASLSEFYGDGVKALCQQGLGTIRIDTSTPVGLGAECTKNVFIGAACDFMASKVLGGDAVGMVGQIADSPRAVAAAAEQAKIFDRKVNAAYQSGACLQYAEKLAPATSHGRGSGMKCGSGQFWDPNGSCYSCPSGYTRTLEAVTSARACVDKPAGELLRSSCAVFKAASEDMAKGVECTTEILTSGVFIDQNIGFDGASRGFCIATGELTYAIVDVMLPGKTPDNKAKKIKTSLDKFVQTVNKTGKQIGAVASIVGASSEVVSEFDKLKSCR